MHDPFLEIAYEHARRAQQRLLKRRRAAAGRSARQPAETAKPRTSPTQQAGSAHESQALRLLASAGLVPLARNLHCRTGEIDLVMRDGDTLVFVEVRARASGRYGGAAASVGRAKQARLLRSAALLLPDLAHRHWSGRIPPVRFDVVAFEAGGVHWLPAAF
ncbi:YraN family protein [Bordetella sp. BOR01]|uniref:YraN family protein n=1 Tax=Bordetella sp. BOR01 TaxID=2854779 RepID=UPI001C478052|nr:YraN family protein [Bordetella sp. BOR01]MBV7484506.1 YraN family protein [Bordetella sp. BOR01]